MSTAPKNIENSEVTQELRAEWKHKYGNYYRIKIPAKDDFVVNPDYESAIVEYEKLSKAEKSKKAPPVQYLKVVHEAAECWLRPPDRKILAYSQQSAASSGQIAFNETMLNSTWLAGDVRVKIDDMYFISIGHHLAQMIDIIDSTLEKF